MVEGVSQREIKCRKGNELKEVVILNTEVRLVLSEKITWEQRLGRAESTAHLEEQPFSHQILIG